MTNNLGYSRAVFLITVRNENPMGPNFVYENWKTRREIGDKLMSNCLFSALKLMSSNI